MIPLMTRKPVRIQARFVKPVALSMGTKKLNTPSEIRTMAKQTPCAVERSIVGNISELQSWKKLCAPKPPPNWSRNT